MAEITSKKFKELQLQNMACITSIIESTLLSVSFLFLSNAGVNHHVHQCVEQPAEDLLRQDD